MILPHPGNRIQTLHEFSYMPWKEEITIDAYNCLYRRLSAVVGNKPTPKN